MFENVTLELSLKPFKRVDDEYIRKVCREIFSQWRPLLKNSKTVSLMLWVGDGSEILDYAGDLKDEFEWARFVGTANKPYRGEDEPLETSLHSKKQDYFENAPVMNYGILKKIVTVLKEEGKKAFPDTPIRVGETFDIGPEFAISDFKYKRHNEICRGSGGSCDGFGFVDSTALLKGDNRKYAAYPNGIPDKTPFGSFLGKQAQCFLSDMGFDFLWLSNGLGFSSDPWDKTGKIFDGESYYPQSLEEVREKVFSFWKLFRRECAFPLETRGTNNSVGIDYATDGVPLYDIYKAGLDITPPPNSPWAALNDNYGLEMMGHMTRICELPGDRFPFRYYLHDPWWLNSPWYDRYDGSPCDIYLPMSVSRIDGEGRIGTANSLNILSIDNSHGDMPDQCVNEPLPHLLKAEKDCADEPAPLVWVYPFREYTTTLDGDLLKEMNSGDNYICDAINSGLPLCCVVSTDNFLKHEGKLYEKSMIITPLPEEEVVSDKLCELSSLGIPVIVYATKDRLKAASLPRGLKTVEVEGSPRELVRVLGEFGYNIDFALEEGTLKPPTMAIYRRDNALLFSVYNSNTTSEASFKFPMGAPILCGCEAKLKNGASTYRFARAEHRECRVFVEQKSGVISCREHYPSNVRFRRINRISGLEDATVYLFPEKGCEAAVTASKKPSYGIEFDRRFKEGYDPKQGRYLKGEHISGTVFFLTGHKNTFK